MRALAARFALAIAFVLTLAIAGCFAPSYPNGGLVCATGAKPCPDDYYCASNHTCWHNGQSPPTQHTGVLGTAGGGGVNAAGTSHGASISVGQPVVGTSSSSTHQVQFGLMRAAQSK